MVGCLHCTATKNPQGREFIFLLIYLRDKEKTKGQKEDFYSRLIFIIPAVALKLGARTPPMAPGVCIITKLELGVGQSWLSSPSTHMWDLRVSSVQPNACSKNYKVATPGAYGTVS